jgi:hypothetical protein
VKTMEKQESEVGQNQNEESLEQCMARVKAENPEMTDEQARAQCTSQPAAEKTRKQEDHGCAEDEVWDPNAKDGAGACVKKPPAAEKGLRNQILGIMKEYGETLADEVKRDIKTEMDKVVKNTKDELVGSIRKGLGLEKDPVVHLSDVEGLVRKIVLDGSEHGKRSETETTDKPTEGADDIKKIKSAKEMWKEMTKDRVYI